MGTYSGSYMLNTNIKISNILEYLLYVEMY